MKEKDLEYFKDEKVIYEVQNNVVLDYNFSKQKQYKDILNGGAKMEKLNFKEWLLNQKDGSLKIDKILLLEHLRKTSINKIDESKIDPNEVREKIKHNEPLEPIVINSDFNVVDGLYRLLAYEEIEEIKEVEVVLLPLK